MLMKQIRFEFLSLEEIGPSCGCTSSVGWSPAVRNAVTILVIMKEQSGCLSICVFCIKGIRVRPGKGFSKCLFTHGEA